MSEPNFEASEPIGDTTFQSPTAVVRKQDFSIYTVMLIIALACLLIGTIMLFLNIQEYGGLTEEPWKTSDGKPRTVLEIFNRFYV
ncbi:MAG: hypothetical protein P8J33_15225 [Pirellulaceae bacterium]|nr:hypothetical protein [Pirellulaceae bacterium]